MLTKWGKNKQKYKFEIMRMITLPGRWQIEEAVIAGRYRSRILKYLDSEIWRG